MKTITFKSTPNNFRKKYLKRNTIRYHDEQRDIRFELLYNFMNNKLNLLNITIRNTETQEEFTRQVTDVTFFRDYIWIISW